jgi:hypothetical protein
MNKPIKAIMLPTEDDGVIMTNVGAYDTDMVVISELPDNLKGHERPHNHIYITSDEIQNIDGIVQGCKVGDYVIYKGQVKQIHHIGKPFHFKGTIGFNIVENTEREYVEDCKKIIATSDESLGLGDEFGGWYPLPNVSQSFIKAFVESGGKEDWLIEYYYKGRCKDPMICLRGCSVLDGSCRQLEDKKEAINLDSDNCVILSAIEEKKMYSLEEMKAYHKAEVEAISDEAIRFNLEKYERNGARWFKEQLLKQ